MTHLNRGKYGFRVASISLAMNGTFSDYQFIDIYGKESNTLTIVISVIVGIMIIAVIILFKIYCIKYIRKRNMSTLSISRQNILSSMDDGIDDDTQSIYFPED